MLKGPTKRLRLEKEIDMRVMNITKKDDDIKELTGIKFLFYFCKLLKNIIII